MKRAVAPKAPREVRPLPAGSIAVVQNVRAEAVAWLQEARYSHAEWVKCLRADPATHSEHWHVETTGGAEENEEWVRRYDLLLALLGAR